MSRLLLRTRRDAPADAEAASHQLLVRAVEPYAVHLVSLGASEDVLQASETLYRELGLAGINVLWDDRSASAGVKFADADLIGIPAQVLVGARGLAKGVEVKNRATGERSELAPGELAGTVPL